MITWAKPHLKQMWQLMKAKEKIKREQWTKRWNWRAGQSWLWRWVELNGLINQSIRASEENSVVVGSNLSQAEFQKLLVNGSQWWIPYISLHSTTNVITCARLCLKQKRWPTKTKNKMKREYWMLWDVIICILYLKSIHKLVYNQKVVNITWLMLHSLQEIKCDALLLLRVLQPTQMKFKQHQPQQQQKTTQFKYENSTKGSRLHFNDLQYTWTTFTFPTLIAIFEKS